MQAKYPIDIKEKQKPHDLKKIFLLFKDLPIQMYVYHLCAWCQWRSEEGIRFPELDLQTVVNYSVTGNSECLLLVQQVLLTAEHIS